jgi:hypothetical protein
MKKKRKKITKIDGKTWTNVGLNLSIDFGGDCR